MKDPVFLRLDEVVEIHGDQIDRYGGHTGIRDLGLLESAVAMPAASFGGDYLQSDIYEMAAACLFHIVQNHPFLDGNKRTGAVSAYVFLLMNGIELRCDEEAFEKMILSVAEGKADKAIIAQFFRSNASATDGAHG